MGESRSSRWVGMSARSPAERGVEKESLSALECPRGSLSVPVFRCSAAPGGSRCVYNKVGVRETMARRWSLFA